MNQQTHEDQSLDQKHVSDPPLPNRRKRTNFIPLLILFFVFVSSMVISRNLSEGPLSFLSRADVTNGTISLQPTTSTLPPNTTYQTWITTETRVGFIRVSLAFDQNNVQLTGEPNIVLPGFNRITLTPMAEANTTGRIIFMAGLDPSQLNNAPMGTFQFATIPLAARSTGPQMTTQFSVTLSDTYISDLNAINITLSANNSTITLNPAAPTPSQIAQATPTPTRISTSTPTNSPTITPTRTPTITPTRTPTPTTSTVITPKTTSSPTPTLTLAPTRTPTPTSALAPTRTPTPTLAFVPAPAPSKQAPTITTSTLRNVVVNFKYNVPVHATDATIGDSLTMVATNLPTGITLTSCNTGNITEGTTIRCVLNGYATQTGTYFPTLTVTDRSGASTSKSFTLEVITLRRFFEKLLGF